LAAPQAFEIVRAGISITLSSYAGFRRAVCGVQHMPIPHKRVIGAALFRGHMRGGAGDTARADRLTTPPSSTTRPARDIDG